MSILKLITLLLLIGLFLYSKLLQHRAVLNQSAMKYFTIMDRIYNPICSFISKTFTKRWLISNNGLKLDFSQLIVFVLLLLIFQLL